VDDAEAGAELGGQGSRGEDTVRLQLTVWEQLL
jgi:hypothetical protein